MIWTSMIDIESMSRVELLKIRAEVVRAIPKATLREMQAAQLAAERAAAEFGFSLAELLKPSKSAGSNKSKLIPKYRNPLNRLETWSGRGWPPRWIIDALTAGQELSELEI